MLINLEIGIMGKCIKKMKLFYNKDICILIFIVGLFIGGKNNKKFKCLLFNKVIKIIY